MSGNDKRGQDDQDKDLTPEEIRFKKLHPQTWEQIEKEREQRKEKNP